MWAVVMVELTLSTNPPFSALLCDAELEPGTLSPLAADIRLSFVKCRGEYRRKGLLVQCLCKLVPVVPSGQQHSGSTLAGSFVSLAGTQRLLPVRCSSTKLGNFSPVRTCRHPKNLVGMQWGNSQQILNRQCVAPC